LAVLLLLVSAVRGTADYFVHGGVHQPFRETVALLERMVQPDEPVVVTDAFDAVAIEHYGNGRPVRLLAAVDPTIRLEREVVRLMSSAVLVDPSEPCRALVAEPRVWVLAYPGYRPRLAVQVAEALAAAGGRAVAVPAVASEFRSLVRWDGVECRASTP
jgi:hypothetical protein